MGGVFLTVIQVLASLSALYMCLSPTTDMYRMHKLRDVGQASVMPLAALWVCNHMWMLYGYVTDDLFPLLVTYAVGDVLGVIFLAIYYRWSKQRTYVLKVAAAALIINALVAVYVVLGKTGALPQSSSSFNLAVGYIAIASSLVLYSSPLSTIKLVIQTKSSESIPAPMIITGVINNTLWVIYGILLKDIILILPTAINIVLGAVQVMLYVIYHPKRDTNTAPCAVIQPLEILTPTGDVVKPSFAAMVSPTGSVVNTGEVELFRITIEPVPQRDLAATAASRGPLSPSA